MDWIAMDASHQVDPSAREDHMFANIAAALPGHRKALILIGFSHLDAFAPKLEAVGWKAAPFASEDKEHLLDSAGEPQTFPPGMKQAIEQRITDAEGEMAGVSDSFWRARLADVVASRRALLVTIDRVGERAR
jgi:hypothetical protein